MRKIIDSLMRKYAGDSFIIRQKARTLFYFSIISIVCVALFLAAQNLIAVRPLLSLINGVLVFIIIMLFITVLLLRSGHYDTAANVAVIGCVIALGLLVNFGSMAFNIGIILSNYQFIIFIVFSALFCKRKMVPLVTLLSVALR